MKHCAVLFWGFLVLCAGIANARSPYGAQRLLVVRLDFSDLPGPPVTYDNLTVTSALAVSRFYETNGVNDFIVANSFGRTSLSVTGADVTPILRMPKTAAEYAAYGNANGLDIPPLLLSNACTVAQASGISFNGYDKLIFLHAYLGPTVVSGSHYSITGFGFTEGFFPFVDRAVVLLNGDYSFFILAHELGHAFGALHSGAWQTSDGTAVGAGTYVDRGDPYDVMGGSRDSLAHYNAYHKHHIGWLPDAAVTNLTESGVFRLFRFDHKDASVNNRLALKIRRDKQPPPGRAAQAADERSYWLSYRQNYATNGVQLLWGYNPYHDSSLLAVSSHGTNFLDSGLKIGQVFNDPALGLNIQPLGVGGVTPNEYVDVQVSFSSRMSFTTNRLNADRESGSVVLQVARTHNRVGAVQVAFATVPDSALAPGDFAAVAGTLSWADGDATPKAITVPVQRGLTWSGSRQFTVALSNPVGGVIGELSTTTVTLNAAGLLDTDFSRDVVGSEVDALLVQPDGKIVVGGLFTGFTYYGGVATNFNRIARLTSDGYPDASFTNAGGANEMVWCLGRQPDGKLLAGGDFTSLQGGNRNYIGRLNADGSLDTTFAATPGPSSRVWALATQPDGKIVIGGTFTNVNNAPRNFVARLNSDGSLDTSFVPDARLSRFSAAVIALAIQPDGKMLIGGSFFFDGLPKFRASVARLNADGSLDNTFDAGWGAFTLINSLYYAANVWRIALQPDGRVIIAGDFTGLADTGQSRVARLNANGSVDTTFNPVIDPALGFGSNPRPSVEALFLQPDGKVIIGGEFSQVNGVTCSRVTRLNGNGSLDTSFDLSGTNNARLRQIQMAGDGSLLLGSWFGTMRGIPDRSITRMFSGLSMQPGVAQFAETSVVAFEGTSVAVTVQRANGSNGAVSVNYSTAGGSATSGTDFVATSGTLSWADGDSTSRQILVPIVADSTAESAEYFFVNLGVPLGGILVGQSGVVQININDASGPSVTSPPQNLTVTAGAIASFAVAASGIPLPTYQWRFGASPIAGATNATLTLTNVQPAAAGSYSVVVTNVAGSVTSAPAVLTILVPPAILSGPQGLNLVRTSAVQILPATFLVQGSNFTAAQWRLNGSNLVGATSATLALPNVRRADSGSYAVVLTGLGGSVTSAPATLRVRVVQQWQPPQPLADGSVRLLFGDTDGTGLALAHLTNFVVQVSSNLVVWFAATNALTLTNGLMMLNPDTRSGGGRYFRVMEP